MENERKIAWARYVEIMYYKTYKNRLREEEEDPFFRDDLYWTDGYGN